MPGRPELVLATSGRGFFRSEDGGAHFERSMEGLDRGYLSSVVLHPARPDVLFLAAGKRPPPGWFGPGGADTAFYRSADQGRSWRRCEGAGPFAGGAWSVAFDPGDPKSFCAGLHDGSVWLTRDDGETFDRVATGVGAVLHVRIARE